MQEFQAFLASTPVFAFFILCALYAIGEFIGTYTKAWIPSVFIIAILFLVGYWTFLPKDIVKMGGLGAPLGGIIAIMLAITHMGTAISLKELSKQWKVIVVCLAGLFGMVVFCLILGLFNVIDFNYIVAGLPPLTGGIIAATMMQTAAAELGLEKVAILAICMYVCQGFAGYPLTAIKLKKEGNKLLKEYREGKRKDDAAVGDIDAENGKFTAEEAPRKTLFPQVPDKYYSVSYSLATLAIIGTLCLVVGSWTKSFMGAYAINPAVLALIFGIIATELGFLRPNILVKNGCFNFIMFILMVFIFGGLSSATPELLAEILGPMVLIIVVGVIGMVILAYFVSKFLKMSPYMAIATSLTALYGFPPNYVLTDECTTALAKTKEEKKMLMDEMLPQMIVGGFVTVTITSVIISSLFIPLLQP